MLWRPGVDLNAAVQYQISSCRFFSWNLFRLSLKHTILMKIPRCVLPSVSWNVWNDSDDARGGVFIVLWCIGMYALKCSAGSSDLLPDLDNPSHLGDCHICIWICICICICICIHADTQIRRYMYWYLISFLIQITRAGTLPCWPLRWLPSSSRFGRHHHPPQVPPTLFQNFLFTFVVVAVYCCVFLLSFCWWW